MHPKLAIAFSAWLGGVDMLVEMIDSIQDATVIINALRSFEIPDDFPDMYVYAIREKATGNIKLGISRNPEYRLRELQVGNSSELELVAYRKAHNHFCDEHALHTDAATYLVRGEWFAPPAAGSLPRYFPEGFG